MNGCRNKANLLIPKERRKMRKVKLYFHNSNITAFGIVKDEKYPDMADDMWNFIAEPKKCYAHHTVSTGGCVLLKPPPPLHPVPFGNQSTPFGNDIPYLCDLKPGQIYWKGIYFGAIYDRCTEPLTAGGPALIEIESENVIKFAQGCRDLWHQTSFFHKIGIVTVSRGED